jgi:hypothetical protein
MDKLNFTEKQFPSLSAVRTKFELESKNKKTSFVGNDKAIFHIPGNMTNTFLDTASGLNLKFKINLGSVTATNLSKFELALDKAGAFSCIKRMVIRQAGVTLTEIDNVNILACLMKSYEMNPLYCGNQGLLLEGLKQGAMGHVLEFERDDTGAQINPQLAILDVCVPLNFNVLSSSSQNIPLFGKAPIEVELTFEIANKIGAYILSVAENIALSNSIVTYTEMSLNGYFIQISDQAMSMINETHGGIYKIMSSNWTTTQDTINSGVKSVSSNIPINVSSLNRLLAVHREADLIMNEGDSVTNLSDYPLSLGHHIYPNIINYQIDIDGQKFPSLPVRRNANNTIYGDELIYELETADDNWNLFSGKSSFCARSGADDAFKYSPDAFLADFTSSGCPFGGVTSNVGSYASGYDFEVMNEGKSDIMYNGRSTVGSDMNYNVLMSASTATAMVIDYFGQHTVMMVLNTRGSGVFEYYQ